jgi:hypothetical protein
MLSKAFSKSMKRRWILAGRNSSANPVKLLYRAAEFFIGCTKISINICILFIMD